MTKPKLTDTEKVTQFIEESNHPLADVMKALRELLLTTDNEIAEHIKWNAPAFYYNGQMAGFDAKEYKRDLAVYHIRKNDQILLVLPTGAIIQDTAGILEGNYADGRRMVIIRSMDDLNAKKEGLQAAIKNWIDQIER